MTINLH